jgi:hypothetical protein
MSLASSVGGGMGRVAGGHGQNHQATQPESLRQHHVTATEYSKRPVALRNIVDDTNCAPELLTDLGATRFPTRGRDLGVQPKPLNKRRDANRLLSR